MAVPNQVEDVSESGRDSAFLDRSYLTYTIPFGSGVDIEKEIKNAIGGKKQLEEIETRPWLFFGKDTCVLLLPGSSSVSQYSFIDAR